MRRVRIRLQIAKAIAIVFPMGQLTYSNVRRYVTRDLLANCYSIRRDTPIHESDWMMAIQIAREERVVTESDHKKDRELLRKRRQGDLYHRLKSLEGDYIPPIASNGNPD